jgi:hypothetical protein
MHRSLNWPLVVAVFAAAFVGCGFAAKTNVSGAAGTSGSAGIGGRAGSGNAGGTLASGGSAGTGSAGTGTAGTTGSGGTGGTFSPTGTAGNDAGSGNSTPDSNCGAMSRGAKMVPPDILIVQDRSLSMTNDKDDKQCAGGSGLNGNCGALSKWTQTVAALDQVVMTSETTVNWGLFFFGNEPTQCGVTTTPAVPIGTMSYTAIDAALQGTTFTGMAGTPTQAVIRNSVKYLQSLTDTNPKYLLLATDGQPNCATGAASSLNMDDSAGSEQAVTDALTAGFPTFVIGIGNTGGTTTLNQLAINGGRPQMGGTTSFYQVTDTASLAAVLQTIVGSTASCTFNLGDPPNDFTSNKAIDVFGDDQKIAKDPTMTDGWNYVAGTNNSQIQVYGPTCDKILSGEIQNVTVTYQCIIN